jgi:hypothetical protein
MYTPYAGDSGMLLLYNLLSFNQANIDCNKNKGDKPWFDGHCRFLLPEYRNCLGMFNKSNSYEHREMLVRSKHEYKMYECKVKR